MTDYFNEIDSDYPDDLKYKFGDTIKRLQEDRSPFFSYNYLIIEEKYQYSFLHENFKENEYKLYFSKVKEYSNTKICDLLDNSRVDNFKINTRRNPKMYKILNKAFNFKNNKYWRDETTPDLGHFHLYDKENRPEDKCPVIHFFVGNYGIFYILCYDPNHEIHKMKK